MKNLIAHLVILLLLVQCAPAQDAQKNSIYDWSKPEIIDNYFMLQNDFDRVTNISFILEKKIYNLSNTISVQSNRIYWMDRSTDLKLKLQKLESRKKIIRSILISSIATLFTVVGIDVWITKKFN